MLRNFESGAQCTTISEQMGIGIFSSRNHTDQQQTSQHLTHTAPKSTTKPVLASRLLQIETGPDNRKRLAL